MNKLYQRLIEFLLKDAKSKAAKRGVDFNEEKFVKKHEAVLPIILYYFFIWVLGWISPGILKVEYLLIILLCLIVRGLNHYFGWIRIMKKD
ncbi:MAG: hypothetical protein HOD28_02085 [Candidatus Marinimicrobia bacterium]|jgi:hypothetical protein|nr:hypothetical protein [Candidatus Neomarinimicrobiota bacterium]MBT4382380.1 hypothetical protein [Candidatus Neomarinimicrobiota bacterium]MBT4685100.1 hypothetical protein [Candidatus Neomarinimicrobiota bacterium]MBT4735226.1 hypothetical protein [Candidatus Neomarinimicrobiota bacterium]|tara:strand:+ start:548 stop:820 length:273 start_codon:yes stop_codon:yes gene_type:complete